MKDIVLRLLLATLIALFLFFVIEIGLRIRFGVDKEYFVWYPNMSYSYTMDSKVYKDVSPQITVNINSVGARADSIDPQNDMQIIAIGGSTTECNTVDQTKTWTSLLQRMLSDRLNANCWIGNFGKSGTDSNHHILQSETIFKKELLKEASHTLYLIGFNDAMRSLRHPKRYLDTPELDLNIKGFMVVPNRSLPFVRSLAIYKYLKSRKFYNSINNKTIKEIDEKQKELRNTRLSAGLIDTLPDLQMHLKRYKENIKHLIAINERYEKTPVFITQPVVWRQNLDVEVLQSLFFDVYGEKVYSVSVLENLMERFNTALKEVCEEMHVHCIDLAQSSQVKWFYDDCHFTLTGNQEVASHLYDEIKILVDKSKELEN